MLRSRRRSPYGAYICAVISALLLLLSVSLLYSRLSLSHSHARSRERLNSHSDSLLSDSRDEDLISTDDRIDELDFVEEEDEHRDNHDDHPIKPSSGYFFDPVTASIRRSFQTRRSIHEKWDTDDDIDNDDHKFDDKFLLGYSASEDEYRRKASFGSDDVPVDEEMRIKASLVTGIEDALLLKSRGSLLRKGWGDWFDKKGVFLRKDRMFRSSFDVLNPANNPLLQDPDAVGVTGFTRGDRMVQKLWMNEFKKVPFLGKKILMEFNGENGNVDRKIETKTRQAKSVNRVSERDHHHHIYADGKNWGYYPGLPLHLTFTEFMDAFFSVGKCDMRVFMVWNSPPWMFTVRHQRGLESLLFHHRDACVVVFSETIELDFFKDNFVNDGYKVAVGMPNLDELLKDTPAHIFSSVWFEWRKTKFYSTHYSELIRLAALYKYGGIYLDSDIIVLKPISFLNNSVGMENHIAGSSLNGAVMAFGKHSLFIKECLEEFYMTYDDTSLRWNGADLLTRVARKFLGGENKSTKQLKLRVEPSHIFFPISSQNISRYFIAPATEAEKAQQDVLHEKILHESLTFHFWNSLTSALIPEPESLVTRLMNYQCIRCLDLL